MEALMDRSVIAEITSHFNALSSIIPLHTIRNEHDYDQAVAALNQFVEQLRGAASNFGAALLQIDRSTASTLPPEAPYRPRSAIHAALTGSQRLACDPVDSVARGVAVQVGSVRPRSSIP